MRTSIRSSRCNSGSSSARSSDSVRTGDACNGRRRFRFRPVAFRALKTITQTPAARTTFSILLAISFCHMLNDMMQSLLPALYPMLKSTYALSFGADRAAHLHLPDHRLAAAAGRRLLTDRTPRPYSLAVGMGFTLVGLVLLASPATTRCCCGRRADRHRLVGLSPRILARRAHGLRRPARTGAIRVSGRRQCRLGRPARCSRPSSCCRVASERRLVLGRRAARHGGADQRRPLVQAHGLAPRGDAPRRGMRWLPQRRECGAPSRCCSR